MSLILEEKPALGLAAAPRDAVPLEMLSESDLVKRALADRAERARKERMAPAPLVGPVFRFFHTYRIVDDKGRAPGYKNLGEMAGVLAGIAARFPRGAGSQ